MSETYYKNPYSASASAGRWNPKGTRMIYAGSSPSVALLEYLCIRGNAVTTRPWYMVVYDIQDETLVGTLETESLPGDWNVLPHGKATQDFGKVWLNEKEYPFLKVPSARMDIAFYPLEHNMLINPDFPEIAHLLKIVDAIPFNYQLNPWTP
jgi:RES domain-containing protein